MNKIHLTRKYLIFIPFLMFFSSYAHAVVISDSSVTLTLDWSSLNSSVTWNDNDFKFNGANADLDGITDSNYQVEDGWTGDPTLTYAAQVTADAKGTAYTTINSANATAHAKADGIGTSTPPDENVSASGTSHRGKVFSPIYNDVLTISFDYIISQTFIKDYSAENYSSWSIAELILFDSAGDQIGYDNFILNNTGTTESGSLTISTNLFAAESYYIEGHVYTSSSANSPEQQTSGVPEPTTLALMGLGLASFGYRRKVK